MSKAVILAVLLACSVRFAVAQSAAPDPAQLQLATEALGLMGDRLDSTQREQIWRTTVVSRQAQLHHFSGAQAETFFQMIKPAMEAEDEKVFAVKQRSLAADFSHDELLAIISFYKSALGQKLVRHKHQIAPEVTTAEQAGFKDVFSHIMAVGMALAADPNSSAPGHAQ